MWGKTLFLKNQKIALSPRCWILEINYFLLPIFISCKFATEILNNKGLIICSLIILATMKGFGGTLFIWPLTLVGKPNDHLHSTPELYMVSWHHDWGIYEYFVSKRKKFPSRSPWTPVWVRGRKCLSPIILLAYVCVRF